MAMPSALPSSSAEPESPRLVASATTNTSGITIRYTAKLVIRLSRMLAATRRHRPA